MSFGWSASDIASLVKLAYTTTQGARAACGQYDELTRQVSSLHTILKRLHLEVAKPESSITRQESYGRELKSIAAGCDEVLTQVDKILVKYNALSEQERSARRLWKKIRFGSGVVADVAELRSRVTYYTSALSLFLNLISVGTVGAVEKKMDQAGGDLRDIKAAVNHITAHFLATERQEGSVLTTYTNDDRDAWRELRRRLIKAGFRDSLVRKHMDTIMAYVKELGDKGALDDTIDDEVGSPTDLTHEPDDSERSWGADQRAGSSSYSAQGKAPVIEDGVHEERPPVSEVKVQPSHPSEPSTRTKTSDTRGGYSGLIYKDEPSEGSSSSTLAAKSCQPGRVDGQNLRPSPQSYEQNIQETKPYGKADLLKPETLHYHRSMALARAFKSELVFISRNLTFAAFIAEHTNIHKVDVNPRWRVDWSLSSLFYTIRSIQLRVMFMLDPYGYFGTARHPEIPNRARIRNSTTWQAVGHLIYFRFPDPPAPINVGYIDSLNIRSVTALCSLFAKDYIRAHIRNPLRSLERAVERLLRWRTEFDKSMPRARGKLQQYYGEHALSKLKDPVEWDEVTYSRLLDGLRALKSPLYRRIDQKGRLSR
ncbi:MAG: hypothetical protein L6R36_002861 [Xanthoria steineri]|nr:MAG: hypothetical protein L6R36_002861 [Xanthoria steineri]